MLLAVLHKAQKVWFPAAWDLPHGQSTCTCTCTCICICYSRRRRGETCHESCSGSAGIRRWALNRLTGRCGHFWEARYFSTPIDPSDTRRVLATLRTIHANPKADGVRKGFHDPYSNYGHYERLVGDGLSEWHPAFLQLAPTLEGCARRYAQYCRRYRPRAKPARKSCWGSKLLQRDGGSGGKGAGRKGVAAGQQDLPWGGGQELALPLQWQQLAETFRRANGARASDWEAKLLL